jgi:Phosphate-selective porin O and P
LKYAIYTIIALYLTVLFAHNPAYGQDTLKKASIQPAKKWYETFNIRGYVQFRYNRLFETNPLLKCEQCDRSWGENGGFYLRRVRIIFSGNISDRVFFYIQPDFGSAASATGLNYGQLRDAYFDIALEKKKEFRLRLGQSKVPFGFENLQSSQNRIPLDRNDALNSAVVNERDLGAFMMWAPAEKRALFARLVSDGLKGSGDYGVVAFGFYNGQTANRPEMNNSMHVVGRVSWPFEFKNGQILEAGIQAYSGNFVLTDTTRGVKLTGMSPEFQDQRVAASLILYPQPLGLQAEYNIGTGPRYNAELNSIDQENLSGGYVLVSYMMRPGKHILIPFSRYHYYDGGKKHELDARSYMVNEFELGVEWQLSKTLEFVAMYTISRRNFVDGKLRENDQQGRLLRLQAQINF